MEGLARGDWVDLVSVTPEALATLAGQPGAALGSSRYRPHEEEMPAIVAQLSQAGVEALFLIGGNGTMAAAGSLNAIAVARDVPLRVVGIPKTIDNDLGHRGDAGLRQRRPLHRPHHTGCRPGPARHARV
jgi:6-phosphofructokinase 1